MSDSSLGPGSSKAIHQLRGPHPWGANSRKSDSDLKIGQQESANPWRISQETEQETEIGKVSDYCSIRYLISGANHAQKLFDQTFHSLPVGSGLDGIGFPEILFKESGDCIRGALTNPRNLPYARS